MRIRKQRAARNKYERLIPENTRFSCYECMNISLFDSIFFYHPNQMSLSSNLQGFAFPYTRILKTLKIGLYFYCFLTKPLFFILFTEKYVKVIFGILKSVIDLKKTKKCHRLLICFRLFDITFTID